jgi:hypothetical protein
MVGRLTTDDSPDIPGSAGFRLRIQTSLTTFSTFLLGDVGNGSANTFSAVKHLLSMPSAVFQPA